MKITVIGTGYVGLVTGVSLASFGHSVVCVGRNRDKIHKINQGEPPFYEPKLKSNLSKVLAKGKFRTTDNLADAVVDSDVIIIAVGTPTHNNKIDLTEIRKASEQVGKAFKDSEKYQVVVVKSTVVPKTTEDVIKPILEKYSGKKVGKFGLCMSPEFLREGNAVEDALRPDRIVIGQYDRKSGRLFAKAFQKIDVPILFTNPSTAEMIKYAANSLFATLISYSNEIARIAETIDGVDVVDVWRGVHLDRRLSHDTSRYIYSGAGFGGSCFPKDTKALLSFAKKKGIDAALLESVIQINNTQPGRLVVFLKDAIGNLKGKKITVLGLTFKPNSDDLRESAALSVIRGLLANEANVFCHDPLISDKDQKTELKDLPITLVQKVEDVLKDADGALLVTAWDEYKKLTPSFFKEHMKNPVLIDGRRIYSKASFIDSGVTYKGIGLGTS